MVVTEVLVAAEAAVVAQQLLLEAVTAVMELFIYTIKEIKWEHMQ
jgi:hypothetical protein